MVCAAPERLACRCHCILQETWKLLLEVESAIQQETELVRVNNGEQRKRTGGGMFFKLARARCEATPLQLGKGQQRSPTGHMACGSLLASWCRKSELERQAASKAAPAPTFTLRPYQKKVRAWA